MPIQVSGKLVMSLVMLAIFVGMVLMSLAYPPDARLLPLVIGIPGIGLALLQVAAELMAARKGGAHGRGLSSQAPAAATSQESSAAGASGEGDPQSLLPEKQEVVLFGYLIGLAVGLLFLGFWITIPIFLAAFLRVNEGLPWRKILILTAICWGSLYLIFGLLLGVVPHEGFLVDYFSG